ncbi:MAG: hypothetical protein ACRBBK_01485 [Paracoccaceae bacterium]
MNPRWFLRASKLARNPPSWKRVVLGAAVIAMCLALVGVEYFIGWPDFLTLDRPPRGIGR